MSHRPEALDRARDALASSSGLDLGDELRRQAQRLAYEAARAYGLALHRIEQQLVVAAQKGNAFDESVMSVTLDVVRTHMFRGLMLAELESGDGTVFWMQR